MRYLGATPFQVSLTPGSTLAAWSPAGVASGGWIGRGFTVAQGAALPFGPTARTEMSTSLPTSLPSQSETGISFVKGPGTGSAIGYAFAAFAHASMENGVTPRPTRTSSERTLRRG